MASLDVKSDPLRERVLLRSAILCDDARREESGKMTIIGSYSGGIRFRQKPAHLRAKIYCIFHILDKELTEFKVQVETPMAFEEKTITIDNIPYPDRPFEVILPINTLVEEEDHLSLSYSEDSKYWVKLIGWNLKFRDEVKESSERENKKIRMIYAIEQDLFDASDIEFSEVDVDDKSIDEN